MTAVSILALCACGQDNKVPEVAEATPEQVTRVEPPCWWAGMKTDLQLLVLGPAISDYDVRIFGDAEVTGVHKAESPNYLFVDVKVGAPGQIWVVFVKDGQYAFKVPYQIGERREGSAERKSFSTADLIYLIMPDRFANGDPTNDNTPDTDDKADREKLTGRHGGDIKGIMDHLDYIADLGATAIWNTPLLEDNEPRESYHGYACSDYYRIDPRFGDNEMYCELVRRCHERGIKMIMDIVTNHCGDAHWWMKDLPFADWVHQWPEYTHSNCNFAMQNDPNSATIDQINMQSGWFDTSMPDMNLDNPYLLQYFKQWAVWWIEYADLDGLRVDTYPYNEKVPMSQWCAAVRKEYPNINIVGEVWTNNIAQLAYWQDGAMNRDGFNSNLPSIMDFPLHSAFCQGPNLSPPHDAECFFEGFATNCRILLQWIFLRTVFSTYLQKHRLFQFRQNQSATFCRKVLFQLSVHQPSCTPFHPDCDNPDSVSGSPVDPDQSDTLYDLPAPTQSPDSHRWLFYPPRLFGSPQKSLCPFSAPL